MATITQQQILYRTARIRSHSLHALIFLAAFAATSLALTLPAVAQIGPSTPQQATPAVELPLTGRSSESNGTVKATESPIAGVTTSVNTLNSTVQTQGIYTGSTPSTKLMPFNGKLGFQEAILRALSYNLGQTGATQALRQAEGQAKSTRAALLPNITATVVENVETEDLRAFGFRFNFQGFAIPQVIGPFNYIDFRAHLSQTVVDLTAFNNYRATNEVTRANRYSAIDARDLIVLAVGGAYLQVTASKARLAAEQGRSRQRRLPAKCSATGARNHRQGRCRQKSGAASHGTAAPPLPPERFRQTKNQSHPHDWLASQ